MTLLPMPLELVRAVLAADWAGVERLLGAPFPAEWRGEGWPWLADHAARAERDPRLIAWGPYLLVTPPAGDAGGGDRRTVVGEAGFHGPPAADGTVEIGYMIVREHRRQGFAEEAASGLIRWATGYGVTGFNAFTDPANGPSINLLHKLGFTEAGWHRHGELGDMRAFRRDARMD